MNYLSVENLSKNYGDKALFEQIGFGLEQGQKVALVAKNGSGKSTLLRILAEREMADGGEFAFNKDISVGFLEQDPHFEKGLSVIEYIFQSENPLFQAIKNYERALELQHTQAGDEAFAQLEEATQQMETLKAWDLELKVKQILTTFNIDQLNRPVDQLSGGQQKRVALSRVLIEEPDFLILDEPTNHLDLEMIEWLENYLIRSKMTLLLVTHDRYFLDRICTEILEMDDTGLYHHKGNYEYYLKKRAERIEMNSRVTEKARNLMRKELDWVRRMPKARGTKAKYRMDAFEDLKTKAKGKRKEEGLQLDVQMKRMGGKILELKHLSKAYGELKILDDFSYVFKKKERIGIVGKNGVGKSTFLNILTEQEAFDQGEIDKGETIAFGYYSQKGLELTEDKRVIDVVKEIAEVIPMSNGKNFTASQFLQTFQFPPEQQYAYVSTLSGGEKRRLYLLTVLVKNPNFLILDEPTNDLDLMTLNILEDFLSEYQGCVIIVTHDRYFMDKLVDHLFVFEGKGKIRDFNGKYTEYRNEQLRIEKEEKAKTKETSDTDKKKTQKPSTSKKKLSYKEQKEYEALEIEIEKLEEEKEAVNQQLSSGTITDHEELQKLSEKVGELMDTIEEKTLRWMELDDLKN
ncbi:ABC-F family ATP-binding cassette domain-containing protein [Rapidithrix thailandica]|uniref:ABC-F family ATP-binding cassette domain-containing protein n=1 Tax=Rapidithrix thailandica TaxID=413964 RepID=A0AAW9S1N9_9BACT